MQTYVALAVPILLTTLWLYTAHVARSSFPTLRGKRICVLIAHPDDEAMFFAPTIVALTKEELGNHVKILCLSNGNADHIGHVRKSELLTSANYLGLRSPADVFVVEDPAFPDNMTTSWNSSKIASVLSNAFVPSSKTPSRAHGGGRNPAGEVPPAVSIDILITFDGSGVSKHINHISLYHGAMAWIAGMMKGKPGWEVPVTVYTLSSTNVVRKYCSVLDAPFTILRCVIQTMRGAGGKRKGQLPSRLMFLSDLKSWAKGVQAMVRGHKSQMRWFRWGWVGIGRYMVVNDLKRERVG